MQPLRVFIGYDDRQPLAYTVAAHSLVTKSSVPISVTPLIYRQLPIERRGLTTFTFTRYLVPYLCEFQGHALFLDADVLVRGDIAELPWDSQESVCVVPHTQVTKEGHTVSLTFERPSVMLFDCSQCTALTPEYIETGKPHTLEWATSIGHLPPEWNYLVGYNSGLDAKLAHFTQGIPCFPETRQDDYAEDWMAALKSANSTVSWGAIMGNSVHARWKHPHAPPANSTATAA